MVGYTPPQLEALHRMHHLRPAQGYFQPTVPTVDTVTVTDGVVGVVSVVSAVVACDQERVVRTRSTRGCSRGCGWWCDCCVVNQTVRISTVVAVGIVGVRVGGGGATAKCPHHRVVPLAMTRSLLGG